MTPDQIAEAQRMCQSNGMFTVRRDVGTGQGGIAFAKREAVDAYAMRLQEESGGPIMAKITVHDQHRTTHDRPARDRRPKPFTKAEVPFLSFLTDFDAIPHSGDEPSQMRLDGQAIGAHVADRHSDLIICVRATNARTIQINKHAPMTPAIR